MLYPLQKLHRLASDLAIEDLQFHNDSVQFTVANRGAMDVSHVAKPFRFPLDVSAGSNRIEVIADPERKIIEEAALQLNNRAALELQLP